MRKIAVFLMAVFFVGASSIVMARAGAGGGGHVGGVSAGHISEQGLTNTNGPDAADRDKGLDRAEDRMSQQGIEHQKADEAVDTKSTNNDSIKRKHKVHSTDK
jgi:hypothetical protein